MKDLLERALTPAELTHADLVSLLDLTDADQLRSLYRAAYDVKVREVGKVVFFRGIIEFSNLCAKNCDYCGIRRDNREVERFWMSEDEILVGARWAHESGYGSLVLQGGERRDEEFVDFITSVLQRIHTETDGELGVTLSLGEQDRDVYRRWYEAGAHRYLLRIETTNPELYASIHPRDHDWDERLRCLARLRDEGYMVGTGVMIGLPGQTTADLARDLLFFREHDVDMIGMGPFIPHDETPLAHLAEGFDKEAALNLGLKMISCARLLLQDVNIAATTALQALEPTGRELGLQAGANIVMPNITDTRYRKAYQLYRGKPCLDENSGMCRSCLQKRIEGLGEEIGFGKLGDSPHYRKRRQR